MLAEKLRQTVMDSPLLYQGETYALTISLGVSSSDGGLDALIHRADLALYKAKAQGRNRIECASEEGARSYMAMRSSSS